MALLPPSYFGAYLMRKNLAFVANVLCAVALVYTLSIHGILSVWMDESGMGVMLNNYQFDSCYDDCGGME